MNFVFTLYRTGNDPVKISVSGIEGEICLVAPVTNIAVSMPAPCVLCLERHDDSLYSTNKTAHNSHVVVHSILIDDFWTIDKRNQWSTTRYDPEYVAHVKQHNGSWELEQLEYNDCLYFNGKLEYKIVTPVRGMYFK